MASCMLGHYLVHDLAKPFSVLDSSAYSQRNAVQSDCRLLTRHLKTATNRRLSFGMWL